MNDIPKHVAIIMDGNGRWAKRQGLPRVKGHEVGVQRVEETIKIAQEKGVRYVTFYAFSKENWQRPKAEVDFLMELLSFFIDSKLDAIVKNNMVFNVIGEMSDLPESLQKKLRRAMEVSRKNNGITVTFALSYSSRKEITGACRKIAEEVLKGSLELSGITEETVSKHLYTAAMPDPDLLIRTSGELRVSNFLLWQISYTELYITSKFWPEFTREEFEKAMEDYQKRERRFGRTCPVEGSTSSTAGC